MKKIKIYFYVMIFSFILIMVSSCTPSVNDKYDALEEMGYDVEVIYSDNNNEYLALVKLKVSKIDGSGRITFAYAELYDNEDAADLKRKSLSYDDLPYNSLIASDGKWVVWGESPIVHDIIDAK